MRSIILTIVILLIAYIVKTDLGEGTLSLAAFNNNDMEESCIEEPVRSSISVKVYPGDTLQSLFAIHPSPVPLTFLERMEYFFKLNPHLQNQSILPGEVIVIPILLEQAESCLN